MNALIVPPSIKRFIGMLFMVVISATWASDREGDILDDETFRTNEDEIIVIGEQPEWRKKSTEERWRKEGFELVDPSDLLEPVIEWFPEYTREEREDYERIRDPKDEKPLIKIFEWKF